MSSTLGPPVGGASNRERTGTRDLCVSAALRRVPDVRHIDIDYVQYCNQCRKIEVVMEASSDPRKASDLARRIGKQLTATTLLIIHSDGDEDHQRPVLISTWSPTGLKILSKVEMSWSDYLDLLHGYHELHLVNCPKSGVSA